MSSAVRIELDDDEFKVFFPYDEDAKEAMKDEFNAYWDPDDKCWIIDASEHEESEIKAELQNWFPKAFR